METNNIRYNATREHSGKVYKIRIRLSDECRNGFQEFAITGSVYEKGNPFTNRYMIGCGAIGDEISEHFPEFAIFNRLHLSDVDGVPMYAVANGMYHISNGMDTVEFCRYYRTTEKEFRKLAKCSDAVEYYFTLESCGILARWKQEAQEAIKILEKLTGETFINDSKKTRSNSIKPTDDETRLYRERKASGYYTVKEKRKRVNAEKLAQYEKLRDSLSRDYDKNIKKITDEFVVDGYLLRLFISMKIDARKCKNYIYYNHTKEVRINFLKHDEFTKEEAEKIIARVNRDIANKKREARGISAISIYKEKS